MEFASEVAPFCRQVCKAPRLARRRADEAALGFRGAATWADALALIGLADPGRIHRGVAFWRRVIVEHDISLLVADFAPLALWAARGLRAEGWAIRTVALGSGYFLPPPGLSPLPPVLPHITRVLHDEAETLAGANRVATDLGLPPLPTLAAVQEADLTLALGFGFLDPYRALRAPEDCFPPLVQASTAVSGTGTGLFVYFSTAEALDEALVSALAGLDVPRRGFLPCAPPPVLGRLARSGMEILDRPATADEIAAYARLILHAAPHGTVCLAALAGLPQLGMPQHLEQLFNAHRAAELGILRLAERGDAGLSEAIRQALADADLAARARDVAVELRRSHPSDPIATLAARLAPEIAAARAAP
jgi:hypothetical protein